MDYRTILGNLAEEPKKLSVEIPDKEIYGQYTFAPEYRRQRLNEPIGNISHKDHLEEIKIVLKIFEKQGYWGTIPNNLSPKFLQHLWYFRNCLEIYDLIVENKIYCRDELYVRCLREGPSFAQMIKKTRAYTFQFHTQIEENDLPLEYIVQEGYTGYDCIFHERYFINWDDTEDIQDWKYSMIEPGEFDTESYSQYVRTLLWDCGIRDYNVKDIVNLIEPVAGKKTVKGEGDKTTLLKNSWNLAEPWKFFAVRRVVPVYTTGTRDTGVPDVETLTGIKLIHLHSRKLSEKIKYSANCDLNTFQNRIARLRKGMWYTHIDFKKYGLTVNRKVGNVILETIGKKHLSIPDTYLRVGEETYKTLRGGGALGWCDPLFAIGVMAILHGLKKANEWNDMDFMVFNDDVEISWGELPFEELELRKERILEELEYFDFILSYRKIFTSRTSVFLEQFSHEERDGLNMDKMQLAVKPYATSLAARYGWKAKLFYAEAHKMVRSALLRELCMNTIKQLFPGEENEPVELGGWTYQRNHMTGLNHALVDASRNQIAFYLKMRKYKEPHLMPKWYQVNLENVERVKQISINQAKTEPIDKTTLELDTPRRLGIEEREALELITHHVQYESDEEEAPPLPRRPPFRDTG